MRSATTFWKYVKVSTKEMTMLFFSNPSIISSLVKVAAISSGLNEGGFGASCSKCLFAANNSS